jgi:rubredoxin
MRCKLCGTKFTPEKGQKNAYWAVNWCTGDSGKLCPACHIAAEELGAVSDEPLPLGVCPFGSDIMSRSKSVSKEDWQKRRRSESWRAWVEQNRPEWL